MARLQQTQRKRVGSVLCLPVDVVAAIAAENTIVKWGNGLAITGTYSSSLLSLSSTSSELFMGESDQTSGNSSMSTPPSNRLTSSQLTTETNLVPITSHKLNDHNYLQWSQSMMMFISGRGKDEYLTGDIQKPDSKDAEYRTWRAENNLVMAWLISSVTTEIGENFLLYTTAKDIWEAAKETFSSSKNTSELFQVESTLQDLRQGENTVTIYFTTLTRYWQQLDLFEIHEWKCAEDRAYFKKIVETKRVFKFLMGLDKSLDEDLSSGRMIGNADFRAGLYVLDINTPSIHSASHQGSLSHCFKSVSPSNKESEIMMWHFRLEFLCRHTTTKRCGGTKKPYVLEVARSLLFQSNVPKKFWGEAILTATYLINRMPSRVLNFRSPIQMFQGLYPNSHLMSQIPFKLFGCTAFVHVHSQFRSKLDARALKCILLGYSANQKGYKCFSPATRKFYNTMDVTFFENIPFYSNSGIQGESNKNEFQNWDWSSIIEPNLVSQSSNIYSPAIPTLVPTPTLVPNSDLDKHISPSNSVIDQSPVAYPKHLLLPNDAIKVYERRKTRDIPVQNQQGQETPICQVEPENVQNEVSTDSKSVSGCQQITQSSPGFDPELDLPIAQRKGVRSCTQHPLRSFISYNNLSPKFQAFVTSLDKITIPKSVYEALEIPEWHKATLEEYNALETNGTWVLTTLPPGKRTVGCKWIFSVKQKADGSVDRYKARLVAKGFTQTYGIDYQETFAPVAKLNTIRVLLSIAVNKDWPLFQLDIKNAFLNRDLVEEVYMDIPCGFETEYTQGKVCRLRKTIYGLRQFSRAWFDKFARVLISDGYSKTQADDTLFLKHFTDGRIVVLIVYVDDIILTGNHGEEIKRLKMLLSQKFEIKDLGFLKYFLGMEVARSSQGISVSQRKYTLDLLRETGKIGCKPVETPMDPNTKLMSRTDELAADKGRYQRLVVIHMEAVNRILKYLKKDPVTWRSKKQKVVARSSAEAEFRALALGICEGIWLRRLLKDLRIGTSIKIMCDNQSAIAIAKNPVHHDRTKHVEIDRHFINEKIESKIISLNYVPSKQQAADILTKALFRRNLNELRKICNHLDPDFEEPVKALMYRKYCIYVCIQPLIRDEAFLNTSHKTSLLYAPKDDTMRLFATQSHYADQIAAAVEAENHCTSQMRLLIDQISVQQGQIVALQEEKKRQDEKCRQLSALVQDLERKGVRKMIGEVQVPVAAVVVMACNRADYLERTIKSVLKYQEPVASKYPLFVSQDGTNTDVKRKALSYNQLTYMQHLDFEPVRTERPGEIIAYYKIARHYKWALDQLFIQHNFSRVIILEDDMEIAPDFFDYFEAGAALLDSDKSILAVSSWNDNGQKQFVHDP
ncbi:hypothetical protein AgCh_015962, partial [Apium graveolens]